jgi:hypothetical protein
MNAGGIVRGSLFEFCCIRISFRLIIWKCSDIFFLNNYVLVLGIKWQNRKNKRKIIIFQSNFHFTFQMSHTCVQKITLVRAGYFVGHNMCIFWIGFPHSSMRTTWLCIKTGPGPLVTNAYLLNSHGFSSLIGCCIASVVEPTPSNSLSMKQYISWISEYRNTQCKKWRQYMRLSQWRHLGTSTAKANLLVRTT